MPYQLFLPCSHKSGPLVVRLTGKVLRGEDLKGISRGLLRDLRASGRKGLLLDLGEVEWPTASGLGKLVALHKNCRQPASSWPSATSGAWFTRRLR
jgi:anti-anti-sigma regulatory factor